MKLLKTIGMVLAAVVLGILGVAYSGLYDVGASSPHSRLGNWLMSTTSNASIERRARDIEVPDLGDAALIRAGINDFAAMCVACHGAPGQQPEAMGLGLNPPPPDLAESAGRMTPAELFWVTKHGIRMTGMPSWGASHDDDSLWPVVAFLTMLPDLGAEEYRALLDTAAGMGHHAAAATQDNSEHDHGTHEHGDAMPEETEEPEDDGHAHKH
jgi:mono/diheme cytochrome c family protein